MKWQRLIDARKKSGMSQAELSKRSGIVASSISHFEAGNRKPAFKSLQKLANALGVTCDYLLGRRTEVGFKPGAFCPVCKAYHTIEFQYKGIDVLVCPEVDGMKLLTINETIKAEAMHYLKSIQRITP